MSAVGRAAAVLLLAAGLPGGVTAQRIVVGPQVVFGDYREASSDLHFRGGGVGVAASFTLKKLGVDVAFSSIEYKPTDDATGTLQTFKAKQFDARLRYYIAGPISAELGVTNRKADPEFDAQSVGAVRGGVRASYLLGPGVRMGVRAGMLFGAKFSGGGTARPIGAMELGLGVTVDGMKGRMRLTGDYELQRLARTTGSGAGEVDVPIQQTLARVGVAVAF
ncbi:MAG TPA: hypothetical protein VGJ83_05255 [Gemmatimonadales bacterium]|jgi:hypothetical protein